MRSMTNYGGGAPRKPSGTNGLKKKSKISSRPGENGRITSIALPKSGKREVYDTKSSRKITTKKRNVTTDTMYSKSGGGSYSQRTVQPPKSKYGSMMVSSTTRPGYLPTKKK